MKAVYIHTEVFSVDMNWYVVSELLSKNTKINKFKQLCYKSWDNKWGWINDKFL